MYVCVYVYACVCTYILYVAGIPPGKSDASGGIGPKNPMRPISPGRITAYVCVCMHP